MDKEKKSVMHELAGVVESVVQNSESAPLSEQTPTPPPPPPPPPRKLIDLGRYWLFKTFQFWLVQTIPPPRENWNLGSPWLFNDFSSFDSKVTLPPLA